MFQPTKLIFSMMIAALVLSSSAFAQDRYSLTLNNDFLEKLQSFGSLKSEVSESARDKIAYIELRYEESKETTPIELDENVTIQGSDAVIILDDSLIAKIKGQPVRIPVTENGFARVLLKYDAPAMASTPSEIINEDLVFIRLSDVKSLAGELEEMSEIKLTTKFGDITIPMEQIAGIRLHTDEDDSAVVVFTDGDVLTGVPEIPLLNLTTDWGKAEVEAESVQSITTTSNSKFTQQNSDFRNTLESSHGQLVCSRHVRDTAQTQRPKTRVTRIPTVLLRCVFLCPVQLKNFSQVARVLAKLVHCCDATARFRLTCRSRIPTI